MAHIVVVGGGPAGCAAANDLSRRGHAVTVCEAGTRRGAAIGWPLVGDASRSAYIGGEGFGGSSSINGAVLGSESDPAPAGLPSFVATPGEVGSALIASAGGSRLRLLGVDGRRLSVAEALDRLEVTRTTPIPTLRSDCRVVSLLIEGGSTVGVRTNAGEIRADGVVVAAGPVGSPVIIAESDATGDVATGDVATGAVGSGLTDHRCLTVAFETHGSPPEPIDGPHGDTRRPAASAAADIDGGFLVAIDRFGSGVDLGGVLVVCETPTRGGHVSRSRRTGGVAVDLGPVDIPALAAVWAVARPIVERMAAVREGAVFVDEWGTPLRRLGRGQNDVERWIRRSAGGLFHASGTCRSVVDDSGRLVGVGGVVVAGSPVLPEPPRWPMAACVVSGRDAARVLASDPAIAGSA